MEIQTAARVCLTTALLTLAACGGGDNADAPIAWPLICDDANGSTSDSQIGGAFSGDNGQELTAITGLT